MVQEAVATTFSPDSDKIVRKYRATFKLAWEATQKHFERANEDRKLFEQELDASTHPTLAEMTLGHARLLVDQALPSLVQYILGAENPFVFIPQDADVSYATARKVRDRILFDMLTVMRLSCKAYLTFKDAVKFGKGYGIIEPKWITPPVVQGIRTMTADKMVRLREMGRGKPEMVPEYTYIPFNWVIPTPDGSQPEDVSCVFVLRLFPEGQFREFFSAPGSQFEGSPDKIIEYCRRSPFNGYISQARQIGAEIANYDKPEHEYMRSSGATKDTPVLVPVLMCLAPDEHVWIAGDKFKIYQATSKYQTLRRGVVAATYDPDGTQWFTPGIINPRRRMIKGIQDYYGAMLDIVSMILHPAYIVDKEKFANSDDIPTLGPYREFQVHGDPTNAISWVQPAPIPEYSVRSGEKLEEHCAASAGQPRQLMGQGTPGMVRGGSGAMESMLQNVSGREKLVSQHIEEGWYAGVVENTLILDQIIAPERSWVSQLVYDPSTKKQDVERLEITRDDIRQVYRVQMTFTDKMRNKMAEHGMRVAIYDRCIENPMVNREEAVSYLVDNDKDFKRLTSGVDVEANIKMMQQIAGTVPKAGPPGETAGLPNEMPTVAGAGLAGGGLAA